MKQEPFCLLCGNSEARGVFYVRDINWLTEGDFCIVKCLSCGLVYMNPMPDEARLPEFYGREYFQRSEACYLDKSLKKIIERAFSGRLNLIQKYKKTGRVLDVGCGDGSFLKYLKREGYDVVGVDISESAVAAARNELGASLCVQSALPEAGFASKSFDVICFFEVLEHLYRPVDVLIEARRILKDDGILVISVPNFNSFERILLGRLWNGIDAPRHLYHFDRDTLNKIVMRSGFSATRLLSDVASHEINAVKVNTGYSEGLRVFLRGFGFYPNRIIEKEKMIQAVTGKGRILRVVLHLFEDLIFFPFFLIAKVFHRRPTLVLIAGK